MNMTLEKAESLIGNILSELEKDSGSVVKNIDIVDLETTSYGDDRPQLHRHIQVELERLPGTNWAK